MTIDTIVNSITFLLHSSW